MADIENRIVTVRGRKVIADSHLAEIYGVKTKRLNEQVRRSMKRFPPDFMFRLTEKEFQDLRVGAGSASAQVAGPQAVASRWSQNATTSHRFRRDTHLPNVFTEHGAIMAANILPEYCTPGGQYSPSGP